MKQFHEAVRSERRRRLVQAIAVACLCGPPMTAPAQDWPTRPLRILVPAGAGSVPDVRARWLAERLAAPLGQPVLVENRPGAGGKIAMEAAARSEADGHTLVLTHIGLMVFDPLLHDHLGYDVLRDFTPLTRVGVGPMLLLVAPSSPAKTLADLVRSSRDQARATSFSSPGIGTPPHLAAELLMREAGFESVHVPASTPLQPIADLLGGQVQWTVEGTPVALPMVKAGRLRALAVTAPARLQELPDVPTTAEAGLPGVVFDGWTGLAVPAATPRAVVDRLYREVARVLRTESAAQWFGSVGNVPGGESPEEMRRLVQQDSARWGALIRATGLRERR